MAHFHKQKLRAQIPNRNKVRAELQKEIGSACPFCGCAEVGHFVIHHIDEEPGNNVPENLILLCPLCHSKVTKGDICQSQVSGAKMKLLSSAGRNEQTAAGSNNCQREPMRTGQCNDVIIRKKNRPAPIYPPGTIGADELMARYIKHLIDRYHDYRRIECQYTNQQLNPASISNSLKGTFRMGKGEDICHLPVERFDDLSACIQKFIDETMLGKMRGGLRQNYYTFQHFINKQHL